METFGPVRSRRFGMSLGINHLPPKACSYACVYCQLGRTHPLTIQRKPYSDPALIKQAVQDRLSELENPPDYLTFVSNGEPTLDSRLGEAINALKCFDLPVAVISNGSLLEYAEVRADLMAADAVSIKVDAIDASIWHKINRPHGKLRLMKILTGMQTIAHEYNGRLLSETMLVSGINDTPEQMKSLADFIAELQPEMAYLALPLRAPAEEWVQTPSDHELLQAFESFSGVFSRTALMADLPDTGLTASQDPLHTLLNTLKVHPMEKREILIYLEENQLPKDTLEQLSSQNRIHALVYKEKTFYAANYL